MLENKYISKIFGNILRGDKVIWVLFLLLCGLSLLVVFSAGSTIAYKRADHWGVLTSHGFKLVFGIVVVMIIQQIHPRYFAFSIIGVPLAALLLVYTSLQGISANDASRWIDIGFFQFQPSEFAKLMCICALAFCLSIMNEKNVRGIYYTVLTSLLLICALIFKDNFSTAILLAFVCFLLMWIGQVPIKYLISTFLVIILLGALFIGVAILWETSKGDDVGRVKTWMARLDRFGNKQEVNADTYEITDTNRQITHANIAIAQGGITGLPGSGNQRDYLPQAYSDFIFAIILEELGLAGGVLVILIYLIFVFRCGIIAKKTDNKYYKYLIMGSSLIIVVQAMTNIAVAVGLIPITGQPLPLLSRGGTSLIITCAYFGIILSCSSKKNIENAEELQVSKDLGIVDNDIASEKYVNNNMDNDTDNNTEYE